MWKKTDVVSFDLLPCSTFQGGLKENTEFLVSGTGLEDPVAAEYKAAVLSMLPYLRFSQRWL
jgi:hypothetical protein